MEDYLQEFLEGFCPRVFPDLTEVATATPYIVWHMIGGQPAVYVEGQQASRRNAIVQINVWGLGRRECNALSLQISQALIESSYFQATPLSELQSAYSEDVGLRGSMQDFSLWADR